VSFVVDVSNLYVQFGTVTAVEGIDLTLPAGASVALVGRNGAGKSTTLRVLAGVLPPSFGTVRIMGLDVREDRQRVKERVGYCPDVGGLIPRATPWEHLALSARMRRLAPGWERRAGDLLERPRSCRRRRDGRAGPRFALLPTADR
jgi:ABC-2 type transport system ATP-binding protein